jgi:hypothetical protein
VFATFLLRPVRFSAIRALVAQARARDHAMGTRGEPTPEAHRAERAVAFEQVVVAAPE